MYSNKVKRMAMNVGAQLGVAVSVEYLRGKEAFSSKALKGNMVAIGTRELFVKPVFQQQLLAIAGEAGLSGDEAKLLITFLEYMLSFSFANMIQGDGYKISGVATDSLIYTIVSYGLDEFWVAMDKAKNN